jgi:uncharacterized membrane protein YcaP (DUF421 family)
MEHFFFDSWDSILRTLVIGTLAYVVLILQLRISGKRTLSKMNAFDFIVTVALGSTLATVTLSKDIPLIDGIVGFAVLIILQYIITWLSVRYEPIQHLIKANPTLLFYQGQHLEHQMKVERITKEEILSAVREQGIISLDDVEAVVLETEGNLSILKKSDSNNNSALQHVKHNAH